MSENKNLHKAKISLLLFIILLIYLTQFLFIPICFSQYYPASNEATAILVIPLLLFFVSGNVFLNISIKMWAVVDAFYGLMIFIYNGSGLYGIGLRGVFLDGMHPEFSSKLSILHIFLLMIAMFIFQMLIRAVRLMAKNIKEKNNNEEK